MADRGVVAIQLALTGLPAQLAHAFDQREDAIHAWVYAREAAAIGVHRQTAAGRDAAVLLECAAFGVPDAHSGEAVRLCVVRSDPALSETEIAEHCRRHLTAYKCPRQIEFRDELPKSNVGKILRRELRDSARSTAP